MDSVMLIACVSSCRQKSLNEPGIWPLDAFCSSLGNSQHIGDYSGKYFHVSMCPFGTLQSSHRVLTVLKSHDSTGVMYKTPFSPDLGY